MTEETENNNNNIKKFELNVVQSEDASDKELKECLANGLAVFADAIANDGAKSFIAIVLDDTDALTYIGAGEMPTLKLIGALRCAEDEVLRSSTQVVS